MFYFFSKCTRSSMVWGGGESLFVWYKFILVPEKSSTQMSKGCKENSSRDYRSSILWKHQGHETMMTDSKGGCNSNIIEINGSLGLASFSASGLISSERKTNNIMLLLLSAPAHMPSRRRKRHYLKALGVLRPYLCHSF